MSTVRIYLHGALGARYGQRHDFAIRTPQEAFKALAANLPGFRRAFLETPRYGLFVDGDWRDFEGAELAPVSREVHFVPILEGADPVSLLAAGITFIAPGLAGTAATVIAAALWLGLTIGIAYLTAPKPIQDDGDTKKNQNYAFSGAENTTLQGVAVPLAYGRVHTASVVVSAGLQVGATIAEAQAALVTIPGEAPVPWPVAPGLRTPRGGWPRIINARDQVGFARARPIGWDYVGDEPLPDGRVLPLFADRRRRVQWDYSRGFTLRAAA